MHVIRHVNDAFEVGYFTGIGDWNTTYITSDFDQAMEVRNVPYGELYTPGRNRI